MKVGGQLHAPAALPPGKEPLVLIGSIQLAQDRSAAMIFGFHNNSEFLSHLKTYQHFREDCTMELVKNVNLESPASKNIFILTF
jgi:hypothetical protein